MNKLLQLLYEHSYSIYCKFAFYCSEHAMAQAVDLCTQEKHLKICPSGSAGQT